jgi:hypothetical protein
MILILDGNNLFSNAIQADHNPSLISAGQLVASLFQNDFSKTHLCLI